MTVIVSCTEQPKEGAVYKASFFLHYKGYKSSANYDGEPSVSNGILYQLPSSHLLIHQVLAKLSNRFIALRSKLLQATALVCILILLTCPFHTGYGYSVDASPCLV